MMGATVFLVFFVWGLGLMATAFFIGYAIMSIVEHVVDSLWDGQ